MLRFLLLLVTCSSAALLFVVQPLFAKYILPHYGGTSSVWTISVFFYSAILLLGYIYAAMLMSWPRKTAYWLHGGLLFAAIWLLLVRIHAGEPLFISSVYAAHPAVGVLLTLLAGLGLPVLLLSSTSIIAQRLWADAVHVDPYRLYAVSNAGSLLGLAVYPFLLEPFVPLSLQALVWSLLFIVFGVVLLATWRQVQLAVPQVVLPAVQLTRLTGRWHIVLLAAIPTFLLTATTEYVSKGIASFPLMWVIPLMLYLCSFIIGFDGRNVRIWKLPLFGWIALSFVPLFLVLPFMNEHAVLYWLTFLYVMITFFLVATFIHRRLYERRPRTADLGSFYVWITFGGAIGSGVIGLLLPMILNQAIELPIVLGILAIYFSYRLMQWLQTYIKPQVAQVAWVFVSLMFVVVISALIIQPSMVAAKRNFYGTVRVFNIERTVYGEPVPVRAIVNGATNHGFQAQDDRYKGEAASYYGPDSGIDIAIRHFTDAGKQPKVAVVGLGAGMMSAYCEMISELDYIEINPLVYDVANEWFTYVATCPKKTTVAIGDGRLVLEQAVVEDRGTYDVIMMDAFTDDAIPVHLLTREAFEQAYSDTLTSGGIVAFHISNKYLDLQSPIIGTAQTAGYDGLVVVKKSDPHNELHLPTVWVLVAKSDVLENLQEQFELPTYAVDGYQWTDERNSVLQALSLRGSYIE